LKPFIEQLQSDYYISPIAISTTWQTFIKETVVFSNELCTIQWKYAPSTITTPLATFKLYKNQ